MLADIAHCANPALYEYLPYDTEKAFTPVVLVVFFPSVLAINQSLPPNNLKEFLAYAKARDGQLNYSSAGVGSMNYLAAELFKKQAGRRASTSCMNHIKAATKPLRRCSETMSKC